jgi:DNA-binding response OmpR family regulator
LALDTIGKTVKRSGQTIALTAREYALLEYLLRNSNRIISRMDIADNIWDNPNALDSKTIEVFISFLRRKIDKPFDKKLIHTVVGMGYVMKDEEQNL